MKDAAIIELAETLCWPVVILVAIVVFRELISDIVGGIVAFFLEFMS